MAEPRPVEELERSAGEVLDDVPAWLWDGESPPIPIEDIADSVFGLRVREIEDMTSAPGAPEVEPGQTISGLLLAARGEIWVNAAEAREWPPRKRFTIAHELGHYLLHRSGQQALFCRHGAVEEGASRPKLPVAEVEANAFAAALLMPAPLLRERRTACGGDVDQLCLDFASSKRAMERRLASLD